MLKVDREIEKFLINPGGYAEGGTSVENKTGGWRSFRPVLNKEKCVNCMICWLNCPDDSIVVKDGQMLGFDYDYCKGCSICSNVCPTKAIDMVPEI